MKPLDYYMIGQRIRKIRKAHGLSQEELSERIDISTTHMSHIETGNTKLSLQVLCDIASALDVGTDELLYEHSKSSGIAAKDEIFETLEACSAKEANVIADIVKAAKLSIDKYM